MGLARTFTASLVVLGVTTAVSAKGVNAPEPGGLEPAGASFVNASDGYLLGDYACAGRPAGASSCLAVAMTDDGGRSWEFLPTPPVSFSWGVTLGAAGASASVSAIDFASTEDGYLFDPGLEVTDDGGRLWTRAGLGDVEQLVTAGGYAYTLTVHTNSAGNARQDLWRAPIGAGARSRLALPQEHSLYDLVGDHDDLLLLQTPAPFSAITALDHPGRIWDYNNDLHAWKALGVPCQPSKDGAAAALAVSYADPAAWALDCMLDDQSSQALEVGHRIFVSTDSGRHWRPVGEAPHQGADAGLAWNGGANIVLATESAADQLDVSADRGLNWRTVITDGGDFYGWANLSFVSRTVAFVVGPTHYGYAGHPDKLYRTDDGGEQWSALAMPEVPAPEIPAPGIPAPGISSPQYIDGRRHGGTVTLRVNFGVP